MQPAHNTAPHGPLDFSGKSLIHGGAFLLRLSEPARLGFCSKPDSERSCLEEVAQLRREAKSLRAKILAQSIRDATRSLKASFFSDLNELEKGNADAMDRWFWLAAGGIFTGLFWIGAALKL